MDGQVRDIPKPIVNEAEPRWPIHIEVRVSFSSNVRFDIIRELVQQHISSDSHLILPSEITGWDSFKTLADNVERITASESACPLDVLPISQAELLIHVYQPSEEGASEEMTGGGGDGHGDEVIAASVCDLPSRSLDGLWDSLIYPDNVKSKLLNYIYATIVFSDADVDFNIVSWNRVVLLHGPPGTGKTSLSRALAQKISIRLSSRYSHSRLLEINSHSLFSRWFSESGKLVQKLFASVNDLCEEDDCFVVVLIDEVESLTAARAGAMAGTEPSDALRVVNALLTQLDKLRHKKNVLVMATSNLAKAIDSAFIDRADIVQYVDLPPREAIYEILRTCLEELMKKGIVGPLEIPTVAQAAMYSKATRDFMSDETLASNSRERSNRAGYRLFQLSEKCRGMSGRTLRRLPVLAHASYVGLPIRQPLAPVPSHTAVTQSKGSTKSKKTKFKHTEDLEKVTGPRTEVEQWLEAMQKVVGVQMGEQARIDSL
ncbi:P-loop containing nucleoside triphosphate hydrolase protein [Hysterangium stoloniferum]|nr:P-loop containing nucleoside triphosphate hydrolase protein [Hysterangium stoloniferum]